MQAQAKSEVDTQNILSRARCSIHVLRWHACMHACMVAKYLTHLHPPPTYPCSCSILLLILLAYISRTGGQLQQGVNSVCESSGWGHAISCDSSLKQNTQNVQPHGASEGYCKKVIERLHWHTEELGDVDRSIATINALLHVLSKPIDN